MQVVVHNTLSGDRRVEVLDGDEILIGRPDPPASNPDIALPGRMVSRRHALLRQQEDGWTIEHLGFNETLLGGLTLETDRIYKLSPGDELRIGQYALSLRETEEAETESALRAREAEFIRFEVAIHDELLDR
ncbi:MAG: FHA domain-containing protein, partial [Myxococcales bacterium]|nr:FHA domain-containing protein [Myxococcales bacterium]